MAKIRVLELFAGIGACSKALTNLGIEHEIVDAVEIDKYAVQSFNAVHGTNFEPQDITKWDKDIEADLIMHGSPCQDFSVAGKNAGGDKGSGTRSSLMYETLRIVEKVKPKYVIWENVKNLLSKKHRHNFDAYLKTMEKLGYHSSYQVLNAKNYGVPQNRERVFTVSILDGVGFKFPKVMPLEKKLRDVLDNTVDEKYYLSSKSIRHYQRDYGSKGKLESPDGVSATLQAAMGMGGGNVPIIIDDYNQRVRADQDTMGTLTTNCGASALRNGFKIAERESVIGPEIVDDMYKNRPARLYSKNAPTLRADRHGLKVMNGFRIRKLTPKECWRLMGFSDADFWKAERAGVSNTQLYKQAGNSIVVDVLMAVLNNLLEGDKDGEDKSSR